MPQYLRHWEEAAKLSSFEKAVSAPFTIQYHGKDLRVEIIKPLSGDPWMTQAGAPGFVLSDRRPETEEVDGVKKWKRY